MSMIPPSRTIGMSARDREDIARYGLCWSCHSPLRHFHDVRVETDEDGKEHRIHTMGIRCDYQCGWPTGA